MRRWLTWVVLGVAWGLLCVGTRHLSLQVGRNIKGLLAERHEELAQVQDLERRVAEARQLGNLERVAARHGFVKPRSSQMVIVGPEEGLLSRLFGGGQSVHDGRARDERLNIRARDQVVVEEDLAETKKRKASRQARRRKR